MTAVAELARGVVMAGIKGAAFDSMLPSFGGYLLFPGDASLRDVRAASDNLRSRETPPIVAIDQEGGTVVRLHEDVEAIPSMMALGAADDVELARRAGEQIAFDLRRAGCTLDLAPVLDVLRQPANEVIGTRSFGCDPRRVADLGKALARGLALGGILPCYKHFPGHGATIVDSHEALPTIELDEATVRAYDLAPFAEVAGEAPAIMSAHVVVEAFDAQLPATLSVRIACDLLRGELRFHGALLTDCLEMGAVANKGVDVAVEAVAAGADLVLFSHDLDAAVAAAVAIERAVDTNRITIERLEEAYARVATLRRSAAPPLPLDAFAPHPGVGREIGRRAITLLRGLPHADPVASAAVSFGAAKATLSREAPAMEEILAPLDPSADETRAILERLAQYERRPLLLARRAHLHASQASAIAQVIDRFPDAMVISMREPFDLPLFAAARHLLAAYGDDEASIGGLADVIFGGAMPTGRLPISVSS
jgi:beta-N-acetylhexosaminidase